MRYAHALLRGVLAVLVGGAVSSVAALPGSVLSGPLAAAPPVDEIRALLRERLIEAPEEGLLQSLDDDLPGGLTRLDAYARHFPPGVSRAPLEGGEAWTGIGAELSFDEDGGTVRLTPFQGGPAAWAGVPDRVRLLQIDGQDIAGLDREALVTRLRGASGSHVRLLIATDEGQHLAVTIEREAFRPLQVELLGPEGGPVLRVRDFVAGLTRPSLFATLDFLQTQVPLKQTPVRHADAALIFDLRGSGGGDLYEALDMAGVFLPAGTLVATLRERGEARREVRAPNGPKLDMPLVVLIGPDTASAAEIFAGALHQHRRATLVGQTSFGKCSSQTDARLSDGSVLRYTNREILLPDGLSCSGAGLVPDVAVDDSMLEDLPRLVRHALTRARTQLPTQ